MISRARSRWWSMIADAICAGNAPERREVPFEWPIDTDVRTAKVERVLREECVADERLPAVL
jgi:hypothetical protein